MLQKDPAFLFYSKDWLEGTAEMLPEEKGVYIDLLAHHHQKKSLPTDTRRLAKLVGLAEQEFLFIWAGIKDKFFEKDHRLYNRKLNGVITERLEKGEKNRIIGTLAAVCRLSQEKDEVKKEAKKGFSYEEFIDVPKQNLTDAITEWFEIRLKSIANANGNANNKRVDVVTGEEGVCRGVVIYDAEKAILENQLELERICMSVGVGLEDAKLSLRKFHLHLEDKEQYPKGRKAAFAGFEKWLLNEKKFSNNGTYKKSSIGRDFVAD